MVKKIWVHQFATGCTETFLILGHVDI